MALDAARKNRIGFPAIAAAAIAALLLPGCGSHLEVAGLTPASTLAELDRPLADPARPTLAFFYFPACPWCRGLAPTMTQLADDYAGRANFVKVDCASPNELKRTHQVSSYPTVLFFVRGREYARIKGLRPGGVYRTALNAAIAEYGSGGK